MPTLPPITDSKKEPFTALVTSPGIVAQQAINSSFEEASAF
jgi:hypothetical protein